MREHGMSAWEHDGRKPINLMRYDYPSRSRPYVHFVVSEEDYYMYFEAWLSDNPAWFLNEKYTVLR